MHKNVKYSIELFIYVYIKGLTISAFARGHQVLDRPEYLEKAIGAAQFVRDNLYSRESGQLLRNAYRESSG